MNILIFFSLLIVCIGSAFIESIRNIPLPLVYAGLSRHRDVAKQTRVTRAVTHDQQSPLVMPISKNNDWKDWYAASVTARVLAR